MQLDLCIGLQKLKYRIRILAIALALMGNSRSHSCVDGGDPVLETGKHYEKVPLDAGENANTASNVSASSNANIARPSGHPTAKSRLEHMAQQIRQFGQLGAFQEPFQDGQPAHQERITKQCEDMFELFRPAMYSGSFMNRKTTNAALNGEVLFTRVLADMIDAPRLRIERYCFDLGGDLEGGAMRCDSGGGAHFMVRSNARSELMLMDTGDDELRGALAAPLTDEYKAPPYTVLTISYGTMLGEASVGLCVVRRSDATAWLVTANPASIAPHGSVGVPAANIEILLEARLAAFQIDGRTPRIEPQASWFTRCALNEEVGYLPMNRSGLSMLIVAGLVVKRQMSPPDVMEVLNSLDTETRNKLIAQTYDRASVEIYGGNCDMPAIVD